MTPDDVKHLINWLQLKSAEVPYGEISIVLKLHAGEVRFIDQCVNETLMLKPKPAGDHESDG